MLKSSREKGFLKVDKHLASSSLVFCVRCANMTGTELVLRVFLWEGHKRMRVVALTIAS